MMHCPKLLRLFSNPLNRFSSHSFLIFLLFQASASQAMGLGAIQSQSSLGQPLRVIIPLALQSGEEAGCVRVSGGSADLPAAINPRHRVIEQNQSVRLEITTPQTVNEPVLNLVVTIGCAAPITRNYVLLLDPPEIAQLATAESSTITGTSADRPSTPRNTVAAVDVLPGALTKTSPVKTSVRSNRNKRRSSSAHRTAKAAVVAQSVPDAALTAKPAQAKPSAKQTQALKSPEREPAVPADRLVLSSQMQGTSLRLSTTLPAADQRPVTDPEQLGQLRQQQERMTAELNDQDPFVLLAAREAALVSRVQRLTEEATHLQKQIDALTARNQSLERTRLPAYLVWILGALALAALGFVAWFASRYRILQQSASGKPWWTSASAEPAKPVQDTGVIADQQKVASREPISKESKETVLKQPIPDKAPKRVSPVKIKPEKREKPLNTLMPLGTTTSPQNTHSSTNILPPDTDFDLTEYDATASSIESIAGMIESQTATYVPAGKDNNPKSSSAMPAPLAPIAPKDSDKKVGSSSAEPENVDFMLDLTESEKSRISNTLDFSIATVVGNPPHDENESVQTATESFFADMSIPDATQSVPNPLPKIEMAAVKEIVREDDQDPTHTVPIQPPLNLEQSSLHFRLTQFASVIEQIEELFQKNDSTHAVTLLRRYVLREEGVPTLMWLMLLEEYRKTNKRPVYSALSEHFARRYARPMLKWEESLAEKTAQIGLTQSPELNENIKRLWGTDKGLDLINGYVTGTNQSDTITFNAVLQRELLQMVKNYPLDTSTII